MKSFAEFFRELDETDISINEMKLGRIWQYVQNPDMVFGIVSAFRAENSDKENESRHKQLKARIRADGYSFTPLVGGYIENPNTKKEIVVKEKSLFIPKVDFKHLLQYANMFSPPQDSVIYANKDKFGLYDNKGKKIMSFLSGSGKRNLNMAKSAVRTFFSRLMKGPHRTKKFVFSVSEESLDGELVEIYNEIIQINGSGAWELISDDEK